MVIKGSSPSSLSFTDFTRDTEGVKFFTGVIANSFTWREDVEMVMGGGGRMVCVCEGGEWKREGRQGGKNARQLGVYTKIILATYFNRCLFLSLSLQSQRDEREQVIKD